MKKRALLISLMDWDSLIEIPAVITKGSYLLDIYAVEGSWVLKNSFYHKHIHASKDQSVFVEELLELINKESDKYDWIIPGDDIIIRLLNEQLKDEALFYKIMPLTKIEHRDLLGSKAGFSTLCTRYNISTPRYMVYEQGVTLSEVAAKVGFPMMVKLDKSEGGYGVYLCNDSRELETTFSSITNKELLVFQQFINGYEINTEVLFRNNVLLAYAYSRRLKCFGKFGVSTQRLYYNNDVIAADLVRIGSELGLSGFGNIVFMYCEPEDKYYLIEIDMRPNSWMYYGQYTGNDFSQAIRNIANNEQQLVHPEAKKSALKVVITLYKKDVYRCLTEKDWSGLAGWLINKDDRWRFIPRYDQQLYVACTNFLKNTLTGMLRSKLNLAKK